MGTLLATIVFVSTGLSGQVEARPTGPVPEKIKKFLENCETNRRGAVLQLEFTLRGLRNQGQQTPDTVRRIASLEADLRALKANKQPVVSTLSFPPEVGAIGRVPRLTWHIDQILSDREMIVRCFFNVRTTAVRRYVARGDIKVQPVSFVVRGVETKELLEGSDPPVSQVFEVTGRERFPLAGGGFSSVWVLSRSTWSRPKPTSHCLDKSSLPRMGRLGAPFATSGWAVGESPISRQCGRTLKVPIPL